MIATDPLRYRLIMLAAVVEKISFGAAVGVLYLQGRMSGPLLLGAALDIVLATLFIASFVLTRRHPELQTTSEYVH